MEKKETKKPFFAKFLTKQVEEKKELKGGKRVLYMTMKAPSDNDEW